MNLRFIIGRAGTGKTHYILDNIKNNLIKSPEGLPIILLVPEQATFQMEYNLAAKTGLGGSIRAQVLSFHRLAHRVLLEKGGAARIPIGELGKRMVLREQLERHKSNLRIFAKSAGRPGFTDSLARSIGEMKTYLISPDNLEKASAGLADSTILLRDKLADIALLYREMDFYLANRFTDPDDYLNLLAEKMTDSQYFRNAVFWIDGFKGFTPQEYAVIDKILQVGREVNISLCLDHKCLNENLTEEDMFFPTRQTFGELKKIAEKNHAQILEPIICDQETPFRFSKSPDLGHLEKNYFLYPAATYEGSPHNIKFVAGSNRRAEVEACAREIILLVREKGLRWRDVAVNLRDLESYHELISTIFHDYGIPVFIDRKRTVMHHPLVEIIRSALEVVIKKWAYEPVFRYLKSDLPLITREKVFLLENYVLAHGIRGTKWTDGSQWNYLRRYTLGEDSEMSQKDLLELSMINQAKNEAVGELFVFCRKISAVNNVREITEILFDLLEDLQVKDTIAQWKIIEEERGNLDKAREHAQIWNSVIGLLDEVVESLGHEELSLEIYADIIEAGFESMAMGVIPPGLDQVLVGSLDRSRNPDLRAMFILGASEGVLPARPVDDGIFSDSEREKLAELGVNMAPGGRRRTFEEQYLIYTALTRAREYLWIGYPMADDEGRAITISSVIERIMTIFPAVVRESYQVDPVSGEEQECISFVVHPGRALTYLTSKLREVRTGRIIPPIWWEVYNWFIENRGDKVPHIIQAVFHTNKELALSSGTSRSLYGNPVKASVSRIEKFVSCPFAHFSSYGLRLRERTMFRLEAPDMGEFFHAALKCFAEELQKESRDWGSLNREEYISLSDKVINKLAPQLQSEILLSSARYRYLTRKLKKAVERAVIVLAEHDRRSIFRPTGFELGFGPGAQLPAYTIKLPDGNTMELAGRIDRLDIAQAEGELYLRVIDYKSGFNTIKLEDFYHGLKLQLLTYLHIALEHYSKLTGKEVKPGGILYFTVKEPMISGNGPISPDDVEKAIFNELKMRGFVLADDGVVKMMDNLLETGHSNLFKGIAIKKDGSFFSSSPVIKGQQFIALRAHLEQVFKEAGVNILKGSINIEPYRAGNLTACQYCSYKAVCKFDIMVEGNNYHDLQHFAADELWRLIEGKEGQNE